MAIKNTITFRALQLANEQRNAYGLRYNDFERYRKHCANRTHRLRSSLKMTHGKGREFKKLPPLTTDNIEDGHLQLLLYEAERAWAYSQELTAQASLPSTKDHSGTLRHSATGRFRRAVNWSTQLLSHCQALYSASRISTEGLLQITIYTLILNGRFLRYRYDFEDALIQLSVARSLLDELADRAATSRDQALATLYADDIGPEIRYCAHELGREKAYDVDGLVAELSSKHKEEMVDGCGALIDKFRQDGAASDKVEARKKLAALDWEGQPVPVRNPELVDVLFKVQEAESKLDAPREHENKGETSTLEEGKKKVRQGKGQGSKRGVAAYDAILLALSDAEDVARKLVEAQQLSGGSSSTSAAGTRDIHFVHAYIVYQLLSRRIQRDLLLISTLLSSHHSQAASGTTTSGKTKIKPGKEHVDARLYPAIVKILDTIMQSLTQMRDLSIVDETPDLASAVDARLTFTKARRCLYLSHCYVAVKKYGEALTLIQHANIHLRETRSTLSISDSDPITAGNPAYYPLSDTEMDESDHILAQDGHAFKNEWFAYNGGTVAGDSKTYKKPLFFDIALNYVQLDMDQLQRRAGKAPAPAAVTAPAPVQVELEKKQPVKSRLEEVERAPTPEPQAPARGGLGSLLGGWWGRK
ncbi:hypothetical protein SERLA73DRAFT_171591 [Serpula lacrymans var. lacrymans S7.3]|uniref:Signal recognition particle subunit SRP68 n=2 Tax=Serpula lacrymans var. lacrymans TaxID=341189 RepID=F8QBW6_SERL3|nr:uncharacterized protein SERLADRAFT_453466 [Serpula lacrymans var. lacrymans S7.9]EGN94085.1 hypothetical protein SERLA73DRAFT_171591 [Serpula lacrymans var. lacrymans S7.3]EGO19499.1 hypothetical protein SERLADRAFT_453466 [Serpula lacrymans var. lacrymans S7.9]